MGTMKDYSKALSPSALRLLDLIRMEGPIRLGDLPSRLRDDMDRELCPAGLVRVDGGWVHPSQPTPDEAKKGSRLPAALNAVSVVAAGLAVGSLLTWVIEDPRLIWALAFGGMSWAAGWQARLLHARSAARAASLTGRSE